MNNISDKLCDSNIKERTVIFDEKNSITWFDQVAIGEIYNIKQPRVSIIINELKEDELLNITNSNKLKKSPQSRQTSTFYDIESVKYVGVELVLI